MQRFPTSPVGKSHSKLPALIVASAVGVLVAGLWLTIAPSETAPTPRGQERDDSEDIQDAVARADLDAGSRMIVEAFATQSAGPATNGAESALIPHEWEEPLFGILLDEKQTMDQRNARLIELATGPANGVPAVQEECVMHLLFGLSDDNGAQFLAVATNTAIPVGMRAEFLKQALEMRPQELGEWLSQQVSNHYEPEISAIARLYLLDLRGVRGN